jgi:hypothetical protein
MARVPMATVETGEVIKRAAAQVDRLNAVNDRQRASLDRHVKYLLEKGLMQDFNEWQEKQR